MTDPVGYKHHGKYTERADVVDHLLVRGIGQVIAEETVEVRQAVRAAGGFGLTDEQHRKSRDQRLRQDCKVRAAHSTPKHQQSENRCDNTGHCDHTNCRNYRVGKQFPEVRQFGNTVLSHEIRHLARPNIRHFHMHGHHISAKTKEQALPQSEHAAFAPSQSDAHCDHRVAQVFGQEPHIVGVHDGGCQKDQHNRCNNANPQLVFGIKLGDVELLHDVPLSPEPTPDSWNEQRQDPAGGTAGIARR